MLILFLIYFFSTKIGLILLLMTTNRILHKLRLTKSNFYFNLFILNGIIFLLLFRFKNSFFIFFILEMVLNIIVFNYMKNFNIIGVTGNIGSGKSSLIRLIESKHKEIFVIDCDKLVHQILRKNDFVEKIKKIFENRDIFKDDNPKVIDSKKIGRFIFLPENQGLKQRYFFWMYTYLSLDIIKSLFKAFIIKKYHLVIIDAPILFKSKFLKMICFPIVTVFVRN